MSFIAASWLLENEWVNWKVQQFIFYQDAAYKENGNIKEKFKEDTPWPFNIYLTESETENQRSSEKAILKD